MLISILLKDFKSFVDQRLELAPLTLLFGANAAGKSNLLDAIRFLQGVGLDLPLADIFRGHIEGGREIWPGLRGGTRDAARSGTKAFTLESRWALGKEELVHTITVRLDPEPMVERESLEAKALGGFLFDTHVTALKGLEGFAASSGVKSRRGRSLRPAPAERHPAQRSLLGQIEHHRGRSDEIRLNDVVALCHALQQAMRATLSLDVAPARMRGYAPAQREHMGEGGENLSAVVRRICQDPERKAELVGWLSALCAPEVAGVEFVETELDDVMMQLVEKDGTRISARSLADGALRVLGVIAGVLTAPDRSLLLVEELEGGLHPARAGLLVKILEDVARSGACQIVATTHSPAVLGALSAEGLGHALHFARRPGTAGTLVERLRDSPRFAELSAGGVERLFTEAT